MNTTWLVARASLVLGGLVFASGCSGADYDDGRTSSGTSSPAPSSTAARPTPSPSSSSSSPPQATPPSSSSGTPGVCIPDNACGGIRWCRDDCYGDRCCTLDCNCKADSGRLECTLFSCEKPQ